MRRAVSPRRLPASLALALAAAPFLPTLALSPMLPSGIDPAALLASPAQAASEAVGLASLALAGEGEAGPIYVQDPNRRIAAQKGKRVGPTPLAAVQPKFIAGQIGAVSSLLRPGVAVGDENLRVALAAPNGGASQFQVVASFASPARTRRDGKVGASKARRADVALAALVDKGADRASSGPVVAAAYAGIDRPALSTLFDSVLGPSRGFIPPKGENDHSWVATPLPASSYTPEEQTCLATAIYFEARGETETGQAAVAQVVLNRVRNPAYPKTICGVVYQNQDWFGRCQFSFACDGIKDIIWNKPAYALAERIARQATNGELWLPEVGSATHYHATYVHPRWAKTMEKVDKIGLHIFYRTFGGGWR